MEDNHDSVLLRDALDRTADGLPPLPDLVPLAVREGRRRRARSRLAVGAAAFAVVTAGAVGLTLLPGSGPGVPAPAASAVRETRLTGADWVRREKYQEEMAQLLQQRLPRKVTRVRPVGDGGDPVSEYLIEAGGESFRMVVSVRRPGTGEVEPGPHAMGDIGTLRLGPVSSLGGRVLVGYTYKDADVSLVVYDGKNGEAPVTATDLFAVTEHWRFPAMVEWAYAYRMEANDPPLDPVSPPPVGPDGPSAVVGLQRAR
ncbi:hypothetical protein [Streptomyces sp. NRRL F-5727]|uniref:hypothetical protein n=1 Tax=Streptomyces sp. NRRL F-5727 TaxID=1463871 RepID=UPI0004C5A430|nr:hypothetical protein [Streptomyces sp. NRRL F-5727]